MNIIILAGGFGTRLQSVVRDVPKPMAKINNKPFLEYLLSYLSQYKIKSIILSVGYKHEVIQTYFGNTYKNMSIKYSQENIPLGTGGAIKQALSLISCTERKIIVLNGDTFFNIDIEDFYDKSKNIDILLGIKPMRNFDRYGYVKIKDKKVISFCEKSKVEMGFINAGIYVINRNIFNNMNKEIFSFEDFLKSTNNIFTYISDAYFIDIGIPIDYKKAQIDFKKLF